MNIDILHRPTALENLLAGRIWPAGRRLPMHELEEFILNKVNLGSSKNRKSIFGSAITMLWVLASEN